MAIDPTRLYTALLNTGLQNKDNPLYQVIHDLIGQLSKITTTVALGGGGTTTVVNTQNTTIQITDGDGASSGSEYDMWFPPGNPGATGTDAFIPYFIGPTETFTVPINKQGLFAMNIDNEGILVVDGFLIEVA